MYPHPAAASLFAFCRPGMEHDCAAELVAVGAAHGVAGWCRTGDGWVEFVPVAAAGLARLSGAVPFASLVFVRQWIAEIARLADLDPGDRAHPVAAAAAGSVPAYAELRIEHPDSEAGRPLARLARALHRPLEQALARAGTVRRPGAPVLHVVLTAGDSARIGVSDPAESAPWPGGIPRLRAAPRAPSRSVLKLEEALALFLSDAERAAWLRPGRTAVDLGAAPGGWTWLLAERGLAVDAVDNARLVPALTGYPRVTHRRADGFRYRPRGPADWLLCDMVEQPHRITRLACTWLERGDCRHALFNLKLPMKRRWQSVSDHLETVAAALPAAGRLAAKQLYHDREEVTVFATRAPLS